MLGEGKARPPRKKHTRQNVESSCPRNHFPSRITHLQYVDPHQPCQNRSSKAWDRWGCWKRCLGNRLVSQGPGLSLSVPVLVCVPVTVTPSPLCKKMHGLKFAQKHWGRRLAQSRTETATGTGTRTRTRTETETEARTVSATGARVFL